MKIQKREKTKLELLSDILNKFRSHYRKGYGVAGYIDENEHWQLIYDAVDVFGDKRIELNYDSDRNIPLINQRNHYSVLFTINEILLHSTENIYNKYFENENIF
jgi:hypothetical protein